MGLVRYIVHHRTLANLLLLMLLVVGVISTDRIRAQFFPDFVIETVFISIAWPGAGPEDIDLRILRELEPALRGVEGVDESQASAQEGRARFRLQFADGFDMPTAVNEIEGVLRQASLPADAESPVLTQGWFRDRVTDVLVYGDLDLSALERRARDLDQLLFKAGVSKTTISGISDPRVTVRFEPQTLEKYGVTLQDAANQIRGAFGDNPAGTLSDDRVRLRTQGQPIESLADFALIAEDDGTRLTVEQLGQIEFEGLDRGIALYYQGQPAIRIQVERGPDGDAIALQESVERAVAIFNEQSADGVSAVLSRPRAQAIKDRLGILIENGITGLVIVITMLFLFLSVRTAFWVTIGIPTAMLATVALMLALGLSLNMVSLFALIICLGIVVDDAIVIGEHADHLHRQGHAPADAALLAVKRMFLPVLSSSLTTIIAFSGMLLIGGRFGSLITDIPVTVVLVIAASLIEVFLLLPAHMFHALRAVKPGRPAWFDRPSLWINHHFDRFRDGPYRRMVEGVIRWRYPALAGAISLILFSAAMIMDRTVGWRFFNAPERGTLTANVMMTEGTSRADTLAQLNAMAVAMEQINAQYAEEHGQGPVKGWFTQVGANSGRPISGSDRVSPDRLAGFNIELIDPDLRPYSAFEFIRAWQAAIPESDKVDRIQVRGDRQGPQTDGISVRLIGDDFRTLKQASLALQKRLNESPGVSAVEDDLAYDKTEQRLTLTPEGQALGLTAAALSSQLRGQLDGIEAISLPQNGQSIEVRVGLTERAADADYLSRARIRLPDGSFTDLNQVARWESGRGFASLQVENGQRLVLVTGELPEDSVAARALQDQLQNQWLPDIAQEFGVDFELSGLAQDEREFLSEAVVSFMVCLLAIYLTLTWIFGSWSRPLIPILTIPLGLVGVVWGHYIHGVPLSMFSVVGFIGMAGIILNDTIVLIVRIQERMQTQPLLDSLIQGSSDRLRAVFLTTLTTVGGLLPLLFESSVQAQFLKPTVITLVYGLGMGMGLVLLMTPAMIAIANDLRRSWRAAVTAPKVIKRARNLARLRA